MNILTLAKFWGKGVMKRSLAHALRVHTTSNDYKNLLVTLTAAVTACGKFDSDALAQALTDTLFLIH